MAVTIISRAGWGAKPPHNAPTIVPVSSWEGICQHWFGKPKAAATHAGCDDLLRSVQAGHQAPGGLGTTPPDRGNDIGYNIGVCPHGVGYILRGWNVKNGANGDSVNNGKFLAVVYMAGEGDGLTAAGRDALIEVYGMAFRQGVGQKAIGHGSLTGSECPGPQLRNFIASGAWRPVPEKPKVRLVLMDGDGKEITRSTAYVPGKDEKSVLVSWFNRRAAAALKELRADGDIGIRREKA